MAGTVQVQCNLGHWHEVHVPDDLITMAEAARIADRAFQTIAFHVNTGEITAYPTKTKFGATKRMVSKAQILQLYPGQEQAS